MTGYWIGVSVLAALSGLAMLPAVIDDKRRKAERFFRDMP